MKGDGVKDYICYIRKSTVNDVKPPYTMLKSDHKCRKHKNKGWKTLNECSKIAATDPQCSGGLGTFS